jgi:hypothetical protein
MARSAPKRTPERVNVVRLMAYEYLGGKIDLFASICEFFLQQVCDAATNSNAAERIATGLWLFLIIEPVIGLRQYIKYPFCH